MRRGCQERRHKWRAIYMTAEDGRGGDDRQAGGVYGARDWGAVRTTEKLVIITSLMYRRLEDNVLTTSVVVEEFCGAYRVLKPVTSSPEQSRNSSINCAGTAGSATLHTTSHFHRPHIMTSPRLAAGLKTSEKCSHIHYGEPADTGQRTRYNVITPTRYTKTEPSKK